MRRAGHLLSMDVWYVSMLSDALEHVTTCVRLVHGQYKTHPASQSLPSQARSLSPYTRRDGVYVKVHSR